MTIARWDHGRSSYEPLEQAVIVVGTSTCYRLRVDGFVDACVRRFAGQPPTGATPLARRRTRELFWPLAGASLALSAALAVLANRGVFTALDGDLYLALAASLRTHGTFSLSPDGSVPTIRVAPFYPWLLVPFDGHLTLVCALQAVIHGLIAASVFALARPLIGRFWAVAAMLMYALNPAMLVATTMVYTEVVFTALVVATLFALRSGVNLNRLEVTCLAASLLGLAALCRPIALVYLPALILAVVASRAPRRFQHCALLLTVTLATVAPWTLRSSLSAGRFVPIQGASAQNIYIPTKVDWNQQDPGDVWTNFLSRDELGMRAYAVVTPSDQVAVDRDMLVQAIRNVRQSPFKYLQSRFWAYPHLFLSTFSILTQTYASWETLWKGHMFAAVLLRLLLMTVFSVVPLVMGIVGLVAAMRRGAVTEGLVAALWVAPLVVHLPMLIEYRFWLPALPFLAITAGRGLEQT